MYGMEAIYVYKKAQKQRKIILQEGGDAPEFDKCEGVD
jgi:hypothetical protein